MTLHYFLDQIATLNVTNAVALLGGSPAEDELIYSYYYFPSSVALFEVPDRVRDFA